jgi:hypothetical protein
MARPPTPAASPTLRSTSSFTPGLNLNVNNHTQPAPEDLRTFPEDLVERWHKKYNQCTIPFLSRGDFIKLVHDVVRYSGTTALHEEALGAELAKRLQTVTHSIQTSMEKLKSEMFLTTEVSERIDGLFQYIQVPSLAGYQIYIDRTLCMLRDSAEQPPIKQSPTIEPDSPSASKLGGRKPGSTFKSPRQTNGIQKPRRSTRISKAKAKTKEDSTQLSQIHARGVRTKHHRARAL